MLKKQSDSYFHEALSYYRNHHDNETNKKKKLHITELKKWYNYNKFNKKYKMKIKKYFLPKIIYLKCIYNLNKGEYSEFFLNFKKLSCTSFYKYKAIYYFLNFSVGK